MNCLDIQKMIGSYKDNELGCTNRRTVEEHLESCPECSALYEKSEAQDALLDAAVKKLNIKTDLTHRVMARIAAMQKSTEKMPVGSILAIFGLMAALHIFLYIFFFVKPGASNDPWLGPVLAAEITAVYSGIMLILFARPLSFAHKRILIKLAEFTKANDKINAYPAAVRIWGLLFIIGSIIFHYL